MRQSESELFNRSDRNVTWSAFFLHWMNEWTNERQWHDHRPWDAFFLLLLLSGCENANGMMKSFLEILFSGQTFYWNPSQFFRHRQRRTVIYQLFNECDDDNDDRWSCSSFKLVKKTQWEWKRERHWSIVTWESTCIFIAIKCINLIVGKTTINLTIMFSIVAWCLSLFSISYQLQTSIGHGLKHDTKSNESDERIFSSSIQSIYANWDIFQTHEQNFKKE